MARGQGMPVSAQRKKRIAAATNNRAACGNSARGYAPSRAPRATRSRRLAVGLSASGTLCACTDAGARAGLLRRVPEARRRAMFSLGGGAARRTCAGGRGVAGATDAARTGSDIRAGPPAAAPRGAAQATRLDAPRGRRE